MDRISVMNVMTKLWDIVPTSTDTPQDIITRAQEFSAQLRSIGHVIDDETLVAAIMKSLNKVEAYKTVVGHLMYT
jgi:hypothetical protein